MPESRFDITLHGWLKDPCFSAIVERMRGGHADAGDVCACTHCNGKRRFYVLLNDRNIFGDMECFSLWDRYERVAFVHLPGVFVRRADEGATTRALEQPTIH